MSVLCPDLFVQWSMVYCSGVGREVRGLTIERCNTKQANQLEHSPRNQTVVRSPAAKSRVAYSGF